MRVLLCLTTTVGLFALGLGGCATPQENPNYKYSSRFDAKTGQMSTQTAAYRIPGRSADRSVVTQLSSPQYSAPQSSAPQYNQPDVYSRVDADCVATQTCAPVGMAETQAPVVSAPWESPTENLFAGGEATPGFQALEGDLNGSAPSPAPSRQADVQPQMTAPQAPLSEPEWEAVPDMRVEEDIPTLTISGPIYQAGEFTGTQSRALMYRVEPGDTAYSIAKSYCTEVGAIQSLNGLDTNFGLQVGQDIKVPSLCN